MILGIHHTSITTPDVDRLAAFYCDHLGFEVVSRAEWDSGNKAADAIYALEDTAVKMVMLRTSNSYLEMFEFVSPLGKPGEARRPVCDAGLTHVCLIVDDAWADYRRLSRAGMAFHCSPQASDSVGLATYGRDPDGNIVELIQPNPAGVFPSLLTAMGRPDATPPGSGTGASPPR